MTMSSRQPHVVVVGAGFGGLRAVASLADTAVEVTLIDARNHHTFQPLLYQVATAGLDVDDICAATRGIVANQANARAMQARLTSVDTDASTIRLDTGEELRFDHLVLAFGAVTADFGVPGVQQFAFGLKSAADARRLRNHVLTCFEQAERESDATRRRVLTTIVIVGGGPTGVEMAGGFAELFDRVLRRDFPRVDLDKAQVILVEGAPHVLGSFSDRLRTKALDRLRQFGVDVRLETTVDAVDAAAVRLSDGTIVDSATVVWAAGVRGNPLGAELGFQTDRAGRIVVDDRLQVPGHDHIYVIGDLAVDPREPLPQVAPVAIQGGQYVGQLIDASVKGDEYSTPFAYSDKGSMATIGRSAAIVELPSGAQLSGFLGWVAWLGLHLIMLIGFRSRAQVLVNWAWNFLTYDRGSRSIVELDEPPGDQPRGARARSTM